VLDTWFSSALWPFFHFWAGRTRPPELSYFVSYGRAGHGVRHHLLLGGPDDLFGMEHMKQIPFHTVFIHGLVRDEKGRKIVQIFGNGIDPIEMIETYGRMPCASTSSPGTAPATTSASTWSGAKPCGILPTRSGTPRAFS
jgi:valyl-tRNA synthetase